MQPLAGIKILDFSTLLPGPLASLILAEAGGEVLKVERPGVGEDMRHYWPQWNGVSATFAMLNRHKKPVGIDLKSDEALTVLRPLIEEADVLLEQFRPGVMARLGLDWDTVRQWNNRLIYCSISGYGQTGPNKDVAGHDLNYIGDTGLLDLSMGTAGTPSLPPALIADIGGGTFPAVVNILLALINRQKTGTGAYLDIAMTDNMFMWMSWVLGQGQGAGVWPASGKGLLTGGSPRYQIYPTADGKFVAAAPLEQKFWENFCRVIALPDSFHNDLKDPKGAIKAAREIIAAASADEWAAKFEGVGCCCTIVKTLPEALGDAHFAARNLFEGEILASNGEAIGALPVCVLPQFRSGEQQTAQIGPPDML